jgi:single-strand DNA-binding protein
MAALDTSVMREAINDSVKVSKRKGSHAVPSAVKPSALSLAASKRVSKGVNEVHLQGCVSSLPTAKILPSGDEVVEFRIVIDRMQRRGGEKSLRREVDSLEIAAWNPRERRAALKLQPGDWVRIEGSVHRRFWSSPKGIASRWQIEVSVLRRL